MYIVEIFFDYYGVYKGMVLVVDCLGIELILILKKDCIYMYYWVYIDCKDVDFDEIGMFMVKDNLFMFIEKGGEVFYFKV